MKEEILVVVNINTEEENIYYCGDSELEAFKKFKSLKGKHPKVNIIRADVEKKLLKNVPFIWSFEIKEILK